MSRSIVPTLLACAVLAACAKAGDNAADTAAKPADSAAAAPAPAPPPPALSLADVAGKWDMRSYAESGDSAVVRYELDAKADTAGWTVTLPNRKPVPVHVQVSGDSIMFHSEPYESVLRKGVQVWTDGVLRLQGGKLAGTQRGHYKVTSADSLSQRRTEGTRKP
jgi:glucose/arabinose dehydrogenase